MGDKNSRHWTKTINFKPRFDISFLKYFLENISENIWERKCQSVVWSLSFSFNICAEHYLKELDYTQWRFLLQRGFFAASYFKTTDTQHQSREAATKLSWCIGCIWILFLLHRHFFKTVTMFKLWNSCPLIGDEVWRRWEANHSRACTRRRGYWRHWGEHVSANSSLWSLLSPTGKEQAIAKVESPICNLKSLKGHN